MKYQETWVKGGSTGEKFQRSCADRYEIVKGILSKYERPFSVFDFGANMGYFSFRIAEDFPHATVIAVDAHQELADLAKRNGLPNVITIVRRMTSRDLLELSRCEAFDVVLALNVLHHMEDWWGALMALSQLGSRGIVETPGEGDANALKRGDHAKILETVENLGTEVYRSKSHVTAGAERIMYSCGFWNWKDLTSQTIDAEIRGAPAMGKTTVSVDNFSTGISFARGEARSFIPGMNLWNAVRLGAAWPIDLQARVTTETGVLSAHGRWHDDLRPWNFILSGDRAVAIDIGNKKWRTQPEPNGLDTCLKMIATGEHSTSPAA